MIRQADITEIAQLARIWFDGWQDAHAPLMPPELARLRTLDSFAERLAAALPGVRVYGPPSEPSGFCMIKDDELYQLYVQAQARGSGVAAALLRDAEARLAETGVAFAWLACAIGNDRAARFYEKSGWQRTATVVYHAEAPGGSFPLEVWRYEKRLK